MFGKTPHPLSVKDKQSGKPSLEQCMDQIKALIPEERAITYRHFARIQLSEHLTGKTKVDISAENDLELIHEITIENGQAYIFRFKGEFWAVSLMRHTEINQAIKRNQIEQHNPELMLLDITIPAEFINLGSNFDLDNCPI